jgi:hypothetical protein
MSSNLKVNTILPSTGDTVAISGIVSVTSSATFSGIVTATSFSGSGANLTGISQVGGSTGVDFNDNVKARFGTGNDLEIFHNGSSSVIKDGGSGALTIQNAASEVNMFNTTDNEYLAQFINGGACKLYYDGSRKFDTLTNGVQITGQQFISEGTITLEKSGVHHHRILSNDTGNDLAFQQSADNGSNTNFTTYLRINNGGNISLPVDNQKLRLGASADLQIYHDGSHSNIINSTGVLKIRGVAGQSINFRNGDDSANVAVFNVDGATHLYHDSGHKFSTSSTGITVVGNCNPNSDNTHDLGTASYRWRNLYTTDLQLSNKGKTNDVDGTWGDWTLQEGEDKIFMINNRTGKKYSLKMEEE